MQILLITSRVELYPQWFQSTDTIDSPYKNALSTGCTGENKYSYSVYSYWQMDFV